MKKVTKIILAVVLCALVAAVAAETTYIVMKNKKDVGTMELPSEAITALTMPENLIPTEPATEAVVVRPTEPIVTTTAPAVKATQASGTLTTDDAKAKALSHAGVAASDATFVNAKLDWDDGVQVYEIEFVQGKYEYEYEINAETGEILESDKELLD